MGLESCNFVYDCKCSKKGILLELFWEAVTLMAEDLFETIGTQMWLLFLGKPNLTEDDSGWKMMVCGYMWVCLK